jgi:hypothetical protein
VGAERCYLHGADGLLRESGRSAGAATTEAKDRRQPMTRTRILMLSVALLVSGAACAEAQVRSFAQPSRRQADRLPKEFLPPAGMCRIWLDNVPANQQPAPTDCTTAIRKKPQNGTVIFGERDPKSKERPRDPRDTSKVKKPDHSG